MITATWTKVSKYTQCTSCLKHTDVFDILIGKSKNCRLGLMLCRSCVDSLIEQCALQKEEGNGNVGNRN